MILNKKDFRSKYFSNQSLFNEFCEIVRFLRNLHYVIYNCIIAICTINQYLIQSLNGNNSKIKSVKNYL